MAHSAHIIIVTLHLQLTIKCVPSHPGVSDCLEPQHPDILVPWLKYSTRFYTTKPSVTVSETFRLGGIMILSSTESDITAYGATRLAR